MKETLSATRITSDQIVVGKSATGKYVPMNKVEEENENIHQHQSGKKARQENVGEERKQNIGVADWRKKPGPIQMKSEIVATCMVMGGGSGQRKQLKKVNLKKKNEQQDEKDNKGIKVQNKDKINKINESKGKKESKPIKSSIQEDKQKDKTKSVNQQSIKQDNKDNIKAKIVGEKEKQKENNSIKIEKKTNQNNENIFKTESTKQEQKVQKNVIKDQSTLNNETVETKEAIQSESEKENDFEDADIEEEYFEDEQQPQVSTQVQSQQSVDTKTLTAIPVVVNDIKIEQIEEIIEGGSITAEEGKQQESQDEIIKEEIVVSDQNPGNANNVSNKSSPKKQEQVSIDNKVNEKEVQQIETQIQQIETGEQGEQQSVLDEQTSQNPEQNAIIITDQQLWAQQIEEQKRLELQQEEKEAEEKLKKQEEVENQNKRIDELLGVLHQNIEDIDNKMEQKQFKKIEEQKKQNQSQQEFKQQRSLNSRQQDEVKTTKQESTPSITDLKKKEPQQTPAERLQQTLKKYNSDDPQNPQQENKKKPRVPVQPKRPPKPIQQVQLFPIGLEEKDVIDYSELFNSFWDVFSGSYYQDCSINSVVSQGDLLGKMRDIYNIFVTHVNTVDNVERALNHYRPAVAPLELTGNELLFLNNPMDLWVYTNRINIDLNLYIQRQQNFCDKLRGEQKDDDRPEQSLYYRVVKSRSEVYDIVSRSFLRKVGWRELPHGQNLKTSWNLLWTWKKPQIDMGGLLT